ncbi:hypothetical protein TREMEDRAFT_34447 [Tremella mesenterica DSM 1558]|uniref:uncharacterized protein n=1 Tax=Tremella mesenterica (strain ATCC 24925 / CBS 8224 / DSM 1558 / NBRC 9311 / NRRL Y-6157 / RJB 2259-6 / UBC 559-6) TaxID=578456 RepID=UPI0003F48CCA|nr:uncharacterized protein TREMEDRAFT_34447 [Tremella mesenterica DSM 1558]EIW66892.1 hypothetical protein TREMEDRAFT_34447 [Tremella mesenterica DSM 1558]
MTDQSRKAWVTLLTNPSYLAGAVILYRTLRAVSQYPLIIMATDALPDSSIALLEYYGLQVLKVPHLTPADGQHPGFDPTFVRLNDAWTKLQVFGLTSYDRLILIDCDMVFLRSMDEVFDMELPGPDWIAAAPACVCNPFKIAHYPADWIPANCSLTKQIPKTPLYSPTIPSLDGPRTSHLLNSGMVLLTPSSSTMAAIQHFLDTSPTVAKASFADQDVIAEFFKGRWRPLPWWANALKPQRAVHADLWEDTEARLVHYM